MRNFQVFDVAWHKNYNIKDEYGGWTHPQIVADFEDYARLCYQSFGDKVKTWITINEAEVVADIGYGWAGMAPGWLDTEWIARQDLVI